MKVLRVLYWLAFGLLAFYVGYLLAALMFFGVIL